MKFAVVILACVVAAAHAQFNRASAFSSIGSFPQRNQYKAQQVYPRPPVPVVPIAPVPRPAAAPVYAKVSTDGRNANILKFSNEINPDGSYNYYYETDNGIAAQEQGTPRDFGGNPPVVPDVAQGSFSWTSPEGVPVSITYVADENGYQPTGNVIPTPPPIPEAILRSIEYNARNAPRK